MNPVAHTLRDLTNALADMGYKWALVGGFAVSVRSIPRFTSDIDLAVMLHSDTKAERTVHALSRIGYQLFAFTQQDAADRLATARLESTLPHTHGMILDLLFASSGIEPEIAPHTQRSSRLCQAYKHLSQRRGI